MKKSLFIIIFALFCGNIFAQNNDFQKINSFFEKIIKEKNDSAKQNLNDSIKLCIERILSEENSFLIDFQAVEYVGRIVSPDNFFNLITWNIPMSNKMLFSGFIQRNDGKIFELKQSPKNEKPSEYQPVNLENWYGALYYKIVPFKQEKRTVYALAAWCRYQNDTQIKLLDVLDFQQDTPIFGLPVFENGNALKFRAVFEYDFQSAMYLDYNARKKRFEFDHLSPMRLTDNNEVSTFGVDMSVDAYRLKGGKWLLMEDLKVKNVK
ncbi:MAG: hypothetical protein LBS50_00410 [Prevotellaceae bacterium]|jgi:hypothetical protein|nr:hypothetical protein [Prevotellaceae bacterium]